jgi:dethiobiotin synthetase
MTPLLITGTASQVGKTILRSALAAYTQRYQPQRRLNQLDWKRSADRGLDLATAWAQYQAVAERSDLLLLEAGHGLGDPVTAEFTVVDLAWDWRIPAVLVVPLGVDTIGQAVAHVALARQSHCNLRGIVLNAMASGAVREEAILPMQHSAIGEIETLTQMSVLGVLPFLSDLRDEGRLVQAAAGLDLERFLF